MPEKRGLLDSVWDEVDLQLGNYIRAKVLEILIVTVVTLIAFVWLGLEYAVLLSVLVGLSVLVPYVGVIVSSIPVVIIAYLQWGWSTDFAYLVVVYGIIVTIDGNVLGPLLFSEAMKIHPVAVIIAILIFGALWGFWGIFFAIPLAVVVKAVLNVWLTHNKELAQHSA